MEQLEESIGTKKALVHYRLETARADLKSAKILLEAGEYRRTKFLYCEPARG